MLKKYAVFVSLFILMTGCSLDEPSLPDWDSQWTIFLRPETVSMSEAVNDTVITTRPDSLQGEILFISISDTTDPESISREDRGFKAEDRTISNSVGMVTLDPPDVVLSDSTLLEEVVEGLPPVNSVLPPIDPQTVYPPDNIIQFERFRNVEIDSGKMWLIFYNNLFLEIDDGLTIVVHDMLDDAVIDSFIFTEPIEPYAFAESEHLDLNGKTITNNMRLEYIVPLAGTSEPDTLTQEKLDGFFYTEIHISEIRVESAEAIVKSQSFTERDSIEVDTDGKELKMAEIDEGMVHLKIRNSLEVSASMQIKILNLVDMSGVPKSVESFIEAESVLDLDVDISGYTLQHHENPGEVITHFFYEVESSTISTENLPDPYIEITSSDSVLVGFTMDSTFLASFQGGIDSTEIEIDPVSKSDLFDTDQIEGAPYLDDLVFTLNLYNEIDFDIDVELRIAGYHFDEEQGRITESVVIDLSETLNRGTTGQPALTSIVLDKNSSNPSIVDLMSILPTDIELTGKASVDGQGAASKEDKIWAEYFIESPLTVRFDSPIRFEGEIDSIGQDDLDDDEREDIDQRFTSITAELKILNGLPLGTNVQLFIGTDSTTLFDPTITDSSKKIIISEEIQAGQVGASGYVDEVREDFFTISLTDKQISVIKNPKLFYATFVEIHPTAVPVSFRKNDEVTIEAMLRVDMRMNPEDE